MRPEIFIFVGFVFSKLYAIFFKGYSINSWLKIGQVAVGIFACLIFYFGIVWFINVPVSDQWYIQGLQLTIWLVFGIGGEQLLYYMLQKAEDKLKEKYVSKITQISGDTKTETTQTVEITKPVPSDKTLP